MKSPAVILSQPGLGTRLNAITFYTESVAQTKNPAGNLLRGGVWITVADADQTTGLVYSNWHQSTNPRCTTSRPRHVVDGLLGLNRTKPRPVKIKNYGKSDRAHCRPDLESRKVDRGKLST